ncbi:MAG: DUF1302 family protein [Burkholderiaceae bacterium]
MRFRPSIMIRRRVVVALALVASSQALGAESPVAGTGLRLSSSMVAATDAADPPKDARQRADVLLDDDLPSEVPPMYTGLRGFYQFEGAYTLPSPAHWSKLRNRLEIGSQGQLSESIKWKATVRANYDAIYSLSSFYPSQVQKDQRFEFQVRETYLDVAAGNVELRLGRQQIVWGEVVGLFFADVVSAKDLRESVLPDFDMLRIPQWAGRAEYFMGDTHLEAIWIPLPTVDDIGKPGSAFYAYPPAGPAGYGYFINDEKKPRRNGVDQNYGVRVSTLVNGWDGAAFAYRSVDTQATFLRTIVNAPGPTFVYTPVHEKVTQYGMTIAKDLQNFVVKAEAVYAMGRAFNVSRLDVADGVVGQNYLDYIVSFEFGLPDEQRLNLQFYQRRFNHHDADIVPRAIESGATVYWAGKWGHFSPQILAIHSLNRSDWMLRPKVIWNFDRNWRMAVGADVFGGHPTGLFGQYDKQDRVYAEVRRSF